MHAFPVTFADPDLYLMADESLIESSRGVTRRLCPVAKHPEPVIVPDRPWEAYPDGVDAYQDPLFSNVLFDCERRIFHCWYNIPHRFLDSLYVEGFANQSSSMCYARSEDGIRWEKPVIGQVLYRNSYENNMLRMPGPHSVVHYRADGTEDRFVCSPRINQGMTFSFSPDGINWRTVMPPVIAGDGETNTLALDPFNSAYVLTMRSQAYVNFCSRWGREWKRHIALCRSRDLVHWTPPRTVIEVDEQDPDDAQIYRATVVAYGHGYLALLLMFYTHEMTLDVQLAFSRDLMNWQRVGGRAPILERGPEGSWDSKHVLFSNSQPHDEGDVIRFWYGGKDAPHYQAGHAGFGTATLRRDGFVCIEAGGRSGSAVTVPFRWDELSGIELNVDASDGAASVELLDEDGRPTPGFSRNDCEPITGDHIRAPVRFKGDIRRLAGRELRLRFHLTNARLFAFKKRN